MATVLAALVVAVAVFGTYLTVVWLGSGLRLPARPRPGWVLLATVVVALGVQPAFRWIRTRLRVALGVGGPTPFELLRRLPRTVTAALPTEDIPDHLVRTLGEGLRASRAELWVTVADSHRRAAIWTAPGNPPDGDAPTTGAPAADQPERTTYPIGRAADGAPALLVLEHQPDQPLSTMERRLVGAYVAQAGQVMTLLSTRASLSLRRAELADQRTALEQARVQLARTSQLERRRLERDLHDGGQQQLLGLALNATLARRQAASRPEQATATVRRTLDQIDDADTGLRALADSLYPSMLVSDGLTAALTAALADAPVPTVMSEDPDGAAQGLPRPIAESLYFVVLEATQNAVKHSGAHSIAVHVARSADAVRVTVSDGGRGFDPDTAPRHVGLGSMADRMAQVAGELEVVSAPGHGTVIRAGVLLTRGDGARS